MSLAWISFMIFACTSFEVFFFESFVHKSFKGLLFQFYVFTCFKRFFELGCTTFKGFFELGCTNFKGFFELGFTSFKEFFELGWTSLKGFFGLSCTNFEGFVFNMLSLKFQRKITQNCLALYCIARHLGSAELLPCSFSILRNK